MEGAEISIPRAFMELMGLEDEDYLEHHSRIVLAVDLYNDGRISLGKAAELADVSYDEFYAILKARGHKIRIGPRTLEKAEEEYKAVKDQLSS